MWRLEEHTADVCLVVEGRGWSGLLEEAAAAYGAWSAGEDLAPAAPREERALAVEGRDAVEAWVAWWRALHRLWTVEERLAVAARIEPGALPALSRARIDCVPAAALAEGALVDAKAVTWHRAEAAPILPGAPEGDWRGRVVIDL